MIAAVLGFVIGGGGGGSEDEGGGAPTVAASNADVEAKFPSDWKKISDVPAIPGMQFAVADRAGARRRRGRRERRRRPGQEGANNSTLLPAGFLTALGLDSGELPPRQAVRLADNKLEAYRYPNLRPRRARPAGDAVHRADLGGRRHGGVPRPERRLRVDRQHAQAQRGDGVPGRAEQGVRGRSGQDARHAGQEGQRRPQGAPERRHPEGAGGGREGPRRPRTRPPRRRSRSSRSRPPTRAANQQLASALKDDRQRLRQDGRGRVVGQQAAPTRRPASRFRTPSRRSPERCAASRPPATRSPSEDGVSPFTPTAPFPNGGRALQIPKSARK